MSPLHLLIYRPRRRQQGGVEKNVALDLFEQASRILVETFQGYRRLSKALWGLLPQLLKGGPSGLTSERTKSQT